MSATTKDKVLRAQSAADVLAKALADVAMLPRLRDGETAVLDPERVVEVRRAMEALLESCRAELAHGQAGR